MKSKRAKVAAGAAIAAAAGGLGLMVGLAHAEGVPATAAFTYTGYLETPAGAPVDSAVSLIIKVWDNASTGSTVCATNAQDVTPVAGRFQITLPDACATAVKASPNLWVELLVDGSSLGRTKLSAVPYALEAAHAVNATNASAATGALKTTLDGLRPKGTPSGFRAVRTAGLTQDIPTSAQTVVDFDTEEYDVNAELDLVANSFSPKIEGYYHISCSVYYSAPALAPAETNYRAVLGVNGSAIAQAMWPSVGGLNTTRVATATLLIKTTDVVTCDAYQNSGGPASLATGSRSFFEAFRVAGLE